VTTSSRARRLVGIAAVGALVLVAGCRPEVTFDTDGRQSQIDRVLVTAAVRADGIVHVEQRYTFASADGGTVGVPDLADATGAIPGATNLTLDGQPATPTGGTFNAELAIDAKRGTVGYDLTGAVKRYLDAAIAELDVLPAPEDTSRQDPNVDLSGTLTLPEGALAFVDAHLHGGRDREVAVDGSVVRFSMEAPIWQPFHKLAVAFPGDLVPGADATPIPYLATFQTTQQIQDQADATTEDVLADLDDQEDVGRWVLTAVAFGLPAIFWTIVAVGLVRRLRERRKVVADVPATMSDPPTDDDPAVVAVLDGEGRPAKEAVAGTILAIAHRKELEIQQYGNKVVVKVPLTTTAQNPSEQLVLDALREAATDGVVEGPPVVPTSHRWWRGFRRDAVKRARHKGFVTRWLPLAPLSGAIVTTAVGIGIFFLDQPGVYAAIVIGTEMIAWAVSFVSGYTLTNKGWRQRALWRSFARYIDRQGKLDKDVGPAGVVVWGPYLVYGAALGEARGASKPLTP
jgi:hypothetical protein